MVAGLTPASRARARQLQGRPSGPTLVVSRVPRAWRTSARITGGRPGRGASCWRPASRWAANRARQRPTHSRSVREGPGDGGIGTPGDGLEDNAGPADEPARDPAPPGPALQGGAFVGGQDDRDGPGGGGHRVGVYTVPNGTVTIFLRRIIMVAPLYLPLHFRGVTRGSTPRAGRGRCGRSGASPRRLSAGDLLPAWPVRPPGSGAGVPTAARGRGNGGGPAETQQVGEEPRSWWVEGWRAVKRSPWCPDGPGVPGGLSRGRGGPPHTQRADESAPCARPRTRVRPGRDCGRSCSPLQSSVDRDGYSRPGGSST